MKWTLFFIITQFTGWFISNCQHQAGRKPNSTSTQDSLVPEEKELTKTTEILAKVGSNSSPRLNADDSKMLFVSEQRPQHKHAQIYVMDLRTLQETRVTYNDGISTHPHWAMDSESIFYQSNTDELKENPKVLSTMAAPPLSPPTPSTEIYSSALDGDQVTRWTQRAGFNGMSVAVNDFTFAFTSHSSAKDDNWRLELFNFKTGSSQILFSRSHVISALDYSDKEKAFLGLEGEEKSTLFLFKNNVYQTLILPGAVKDPQNPRWVPSQSTFVFAGHLTQEPEKVRFFHYDLKDRCVRIIKDSPVMAPLREVEAVIDHSAKYVYFVLNRQKDLQIQRSLFKGTEGTCL